jgi:hypothetical protein
LNIYIWPKVVLALLVLAASARAGETYQIRKLSERETTQTYLDVLRDGCAYANREWKTATFNPAAGYWGNAVSRGDGGIRTISDMVLACATLVKYDDSLNDSQRRELLRKVTAALRYVTSTHVTGNQKCTDGKPWGATPKFGSESWQSGMWTGTLASGAWLVWDRLDPELRGAFERVVAWEDDILANRKPPNNLWADTKAEENGWEVPCLVLGELMFPSNAHAAKWHEAAVKYMMNTLCTQGDTQDATIVDGWPTKNWVGGANLQPDFTLENHNIFHPSYVGCSSYFMTQASLYYAYAKRPIPRSAMHHTAETWRMFRKILLPWGEAAYPQGMDWELHGLPYINLYATLATRDKDAFASRMEQCELQYIRAWQNMGKGDLSFPGSRFGITRHSINCEQAAFGLLAHEVFGPAAEPLSWSQANAQESGVFDYPYVDFIEHRTEQKFVSLSWKNRLMGLIIPIGPGHEGEPMFSTPIANGLIGSFDLSPRGDVTSKVVEHSRQKTADGFETHGTILLNGGRLKQTLCLRSIGRQSIVYEDRVTALSDVTVQTERGVPLGIENDKISGGTRTVTDKDRQIEFDWKHPKPQQPLAGSWANVDGRLGIVTVTGSGMSYAQASGYTRGISVCSDILYGSFANQARPFKAGDEVARRVVVLFVEVTPKETASLAESCKIENKPEVRELHFKQPSGEETAIRLPE